MMLDAFAKSRQIDWRVGVVGRDRWLRDDRRFTLEHAEKLLGDRRVSKGAHPDELRGMMRQSARDLLGLVGVSGSQFVALG